MTCTKPNKKTWECPKNKIRSAKKMVNLIQKWWLFVSNPVPKSEWAGTWPGPCQMASAWTSWLRFLLSDVVWLFKMQIDRQTSLKNRHGDISTSKCREKIKTFAPLTLEPCSSPWATPVRRATVWWCCDGGWAGDVLRCVRSECCWVKLLQQVRQKLGFCSKSPTFSGLEPKFGQHQRLSRENVAGLARSVTWYQVNPLWCSHCLR